MELDQFPAATLSVPEAAQVLGISTERAYDSVKAGEIPVLRFGRRVRVPKHALQQLLETGTWEGRKPDLQVIRGGRAA